MDAEGVVVRVVPATEGLDVVYEAHGEARLALSGDARRLAVVARDAVVVLDTEGMKPVAAPVVPEGLAGLTSLALGPRGALMATGDRDGWVRVVRVADGALVQEAPGHAARVAALAFGTDGQLWSASWDGTVRRWALEEGAWTP